MVRGDIIFFKLYYYNFCIVVLLFLFYFFDFNSIIGFIDLEMLKRVEEIILVCNRV